jgi:murein DD-endopeptidase MepM/ murein hydrolase activator NlpD
VYAVTTASVTLAGDNGSDCGNTVLLAGGDGFVYTYCHLSVIEVQPGQTVEPGAVLGLSGGAVGSPGAGSSTGPHLHLGMKVGATAVCPQTVLTDWYRGVLTSPATAPATGCVA